MSIEKLRELIENGNVAEALKDDVLDKHGRTVCEGYKTDWQSRDDAGWHEVLREINKLARQLNESKYSESGDIVSNIKFPSIATAIIQFHARAYPSIIKGREVCKCAVVGQDPEGKKAKRGQRVATAINYQLLEQMSGWDEDMDKMLFILALTGSVFKKTYRCPVDNTNKSPLVLAEDLVVHYWTPKLEDAKRITHVLTYTPNEIEERIRSGVWLKHEYLGDQGDEKYDDSDDDRPRVYLEQHCWLDLDGDGYKEPWIVTVHKESEKVVSIVERFDIDEILVNDKDEIYRIPAIDYFTHYWFMPSLDRPEEGTGIPLYGMGFGSLLSPITRAINSTLNQLIESGTMYTRGGGFIGQNVRFGKTGSVYFRMNEWKRIKFTGQKLSDNIVPLPQREPSMVLFQLLGSMIDASKELASMSDVLAGQNPGRDVPATTTMALIEQGLKVFSAVFKRIHKSLKSELKKVRRLDQLFMLDEEYLRILDDPELGQPIETQPQIICQNEFSAHDHDIVPISDEADITDVQRLVRAEALLPLAGQGFPPQEIYGRYLEALRVPDTDKILSQYNPPPDPKAVIEQAKLEFERERLDKQSDLKVRELQVRGMEAIASAVKDYAAAAKLYHEADTEADTQTGEDGKKTVQKPGRVNKYIDLADQCVEMLRAYNREMGIGTDEEGIQPVVERPGGEMVPGADSAGIAEPEIPGAQPVVPEPVGP